MNSVESRTDGVITVKGVKFSETYSSELRTIDKTDDAHDEVSDQKYDTEEEDGRTSCWDRDDGFHRYIPSHLRERFFSVLGGMSAFVVKVACAAVFGSSGLIYWSWLQESDRKKMPESDTSRYIDITLVLTQQLFFIFCPDFLYSWFSRRMDVDKALMFGFIITIIGYFCLAWVDSPLDPITMYSCLTGVGLGLANSAVNLIPTLYYPSTGTYKHPLSYHKWVRSLFHEFDDCASLALIVVLPSLTLFPLACHTNTYDWRTITLPLIIFMAGCFVMAVVNTMPLRAFRVHIPVSYKYVEEWSFKGSRAITMTKTQEDDEEEKTKEENEKMGKNNVKTKEDNGATREDDGETTEEFIITINNQEDDKTTNKTKPVPENQNNAKAESALRRSTAIIQKLDLDKDIGAYLMYVIMMGCAGGIFFVYLPVTLLKHGHDFCDICDLYRIFAISFSVSIVVIMILFLIFRPCHLFLMALCSILGIFNVYCFGVRIPKEEISSWGNLLYFAGSWGVFFAWVMMMENHRHHHLARNDIIPMSNMKNFAFGLSLLVWPPLASMAKGDDLDSLYAYIMCPLLLYWIMTLCWVVAEAMWRREVASLCLRHGIHTVERNVLEITTVGRDTEESNVEAGRKEKQVRKTIKLHWREKAEEIV